MTPPEISPAGHDGYNDNATFTFTPAEDIKYNFSIEQDLSLVDARTHAVTVAGNSSFLLMISVLVSQDGSNYNTSVYARNSTNLGLTWSFPLLTNLTYYGTDFFIQPKLLFNSSDGSFILMMISSSLSPWFWNSIDGITWFYVDQIITVGGSGTDIMNCDATLSGNNSEILVATTLDWGAGYIYFFKSQNGKFTGVPTISIGGSPDYFYSPAIAMSPTNKIVVFWWNETARCYYSSSSSSYGTDGTWSFPAVKLDASRGLGQVIYTDNTSFTSYGFQVAYNAATSQLHGYMIVNRTSLFSMVSVDDGAHWANFSNFRQYGFNSYIYAMQFADLQDGNTTLALTTNFNGNSIPNFLGFGSAYFLRPKIVRQQINATASNGIIQQISWDGTNLAAGFVPDGTYLARLWYKDSISSQLNPSPSEARVQVDNTPPNCVMSQENEYFSPAASPGVQDTTSLNILSSENGQYDVFYKNLAGNSWKPEVRVTDNPAQDYLGDVAIDDNNRIWCVYTSFQAGDPDIYLQTSDDFGVTFSAPQPIVAGSTQDYCPSIAVTKSAVYVAFMRMVPDLRNPNPNAPPVFDIYSTKSTDSGQTWTLPVNLTATNYNLNAGYGISYSSPDILVTPNNTILVAYSLYCGLTYQQYEIINSTNGGLSFSNPSIIEKNTGGAMPVAPVAIYYDAGSNKLYAVTGRNWPFWQGTYFLNLEFDFSVSSDTGSSWSLLSNNNIIQQYLYNQGDAFLIRGLTLDVVNPGLFLVRALFKPYNGQSTIRTLLSPDGMSWSQLPDNTTDTVANSYMDDLLPPGELRSGHSPQGDIFYVYDRSPAATMNRNVYLSPFTTSVQHQSGTMIQGKNQVVTWDGRDFWGGIQDGNYTASVTITDKAGNVARQNFNCTLDDYIVPLAYDISNLNDLTPRSDEIIAATFSPPLDAPVFLYYRYSPLDVWTILPASVNATDVFATIPANPTAENAYFYFNATDAAGNTFVTAIGNYYEPSVGIQIQDLSQLLNQTSWDPFGMVVAVTAGSQYVSYMYVNYTIDSITYQVLLTSENSTRFVLPTINLATYVDYINYSLWIHFTNDKEQFQQNITLQAPQNIPVQIKDLQQLLKNTAWDPLDMTVFVPTGYQYVDCLFVNYTLGGISYQEVLLNQSIGAYILSPILLPSLPGSIIYSLYLRLLNGQTILEQTIPLNAPTFVVSEGDIKASFTSPDPERKLDDSIQFSIKGLDLAHTAHVYLDYKLNNASTYSTIEMSLVNGTTYTTELQGSQQTFSLEYQIRLVDQAGAEHILLVVNGKDAITQKYIPAFPVVELSVAVEVMMAIISGAGGVVFAIFYFRNKRRSVRNVQDRFLASLRSLADTETITNLERSVAGNKPAKIQPSSKVVLDRGSSMFKFGVIGTFVLLSFGLLFIFVVPNGTYAMIITFGAIVLSTYAWYELGLNDIARMMYSDEKPQYRLAILTILLSGLSIISFMAAGTLVDWFNYYVIEDTFTLGAIHIPNLWITLFSTFLSSAVILIITNYHDLNKSRADTLLEQRVATNAKVLWEHREENVSYYNKWWVISSISFIGYIAMAVLSTTDLGRYATIGLLAILPFILVMVAFFLVDIFRSAKAPSVQDALDSWLIEPTKTCPNCGTSNLFGNNYCTSCQYNFGADMVVIDDTVECEECEYMSPAGSTYCRLCGTALPEKDASEEEDIKEADETNTNKPAKARIAARFSALGAAASGLLRRKGRKKPD
ncbi:MAG TPA: hypothetical protein VKK79_03195 [Candidatus Lokiarchaeia archaeon]|nr:hypothetical protein [Candidatus Lokiarchaeia archaeon]